MLDHAAESPVSPDMMSCWANAGKSTLLKLMTGDLEPLDGMVKRHNHLKIGMYHQHLTELLDPTLNPLEYMVWFIWTCVFISSYVPCSDCSHAGTTPCSFVGQPATVGSILFCYSWLMACCAFLPALSM